MAVAAAIGVGNYDEGFPPSRPKHFKTKKLTGGGEKTGRIDQFEQKICGGSPNAQQQMAMFRCDTAGRGAIQDATNKATCLQNSVARKRSISKKRY